MKVITKPMLKTAMPKIPAFDRSPCPLAVTLDILGDKWTLIVMRDLFRGVARYSEFLKSPEGIPTNILAERLKRLEDHGLVERSAYQDNPLRYEYALTKKGRLILPVIREMARWGNAHYPGTIKPPAGLMRG